MSQKKVKGNKAGASLYVGVGGIGGRIVRKVASLAKNDDLSKARFVIMDTDVNDLGRAEGEINISTIQTSSPRTIRDYLLQDKDAREEWFPNNMIINSKTVSEGAGQVRSISRLALNATIRTGAINKLYAAIDDLYDKDGGDKKQTIKVAVASTVAGGTGSGIAMIVAMLIRNYIAENYPDSSAIIRGFMIMPGVMDTVGPSTSEKLSLQRNGYATIKEINAFMMRPFFEAIPELRRYLDLSIEVPNASGGVDKLTCSPFDFCFLFDRTDGNVCNMSNLGQYQDYVAHSIYELFIGPMSAKAASKEDNIHKEFLDDKKLSRNRFGGAGASVVRYPYEQIRDYVAYEWMEKQLIGFTSEQVGEADSRDIVASGWLAYDKKFYEDMKEYNNNPTGKEQPKRGEIFVQGIETGTDDLAKRLREYYIERKNKKYDDNKSVDPEASIPSVENYISAVSERARELYVTPIESIATDFEQAKKMTATKGEFKMRYSFINAAEVMVDPQQIRKIAKSFVESIFNGSAKMTDKAPEAYMFEELMSLDGKALHPNAMRYLLYKLRERLESLTQKEPNYTSYEENVTNICFGKKIDKDGGEREIKDFQVFGNGKEHNLSEMCDSCDEGGTETNREECNKKLKSYANAIDKNYLAFIRYYVCVEMKDYVTRLINKFEEFYDKFERKILGLAKKKKGVIAAIAFKNGNCEYNLFSNPAHLRMLAAEQTMPQSGGQHEWNLYAGIYNGIKFNAQKASIIMNNVFSDEKEDDIFDTVMVDQFREMVDSCSDLDMDIVRACGLEHKVKYLCMAEETPNEVTKEEYKEIASDSAAKNAHLAAVIRKGQELACPSIIRKDFEEERAVNAMAFNKFMEDGEGMFLDGEFFKDDYATDTVSKYELRFYRSLYNITPIQLQKLCSPQADPSQILDCVDGMECTAPGMVGTYFTAYQDYMRKIGPDNRLNPVITPHIDKRWNSITVLPELDPMEYQRTLMKRIHKAMIYGFIFQIIEKRMTSKYDADKLVYEYIDGRNGPRKFIVSNHTKCDRLFEVLDSLYFDRYAVHSIHETVDKKREKEFEDSTSYEETTFAKYLSRIERKMLIDIKERRIEAEEKLAGRPVSLLEIPILYWNSLPKKDESELGIMVDAIFEILEKEIGTFVNADDFAPLVAGSIVEHYNLMYNNFCECPSVYMGSNKYVTDNDPREILNNDVAIKLIRKKVLEKIDGLDVSKSDEFSLCDQTEKDALFV